MADSIYEQLAGALNARSTAFPAVKCKEFFDLVEFLFTPEEAKIAVAMPLGSAPVEAIAANLDSQDLNRLKSQLEGMADHGLINIREKDGKKLYEGLPFVPGITEYQLMRGIVDERHKKIAVLLRDYARAMIKTLMSPDAPKIESFAPAKDGKRVPVEHDIPTIQPSYRLRNSRNCCVTQNTSLPVHASAVIRVYCWERNARSRPTIA